MTEQERWTEGVSCVLYRPADVDILPSEFLVCEEV